MKRKKKQWIIKYIYDLNVQVHRKKSVTVSCKANFNTYHDTDGD